MVCYSTGGLRSGFDIPSLFTSTLGYSFGFTALSAPYTLGIWTSAAFFADLVFIGLNYINGNGVIFIWQDGVNVEW